MKEYRLSYEDQRGNIVSLHPTCVSRETVLRYLDEWGELEGMRCAFIEEREVSEWTRTMWEEGHA